MRYIPLKIQIFFLLWLLWSAVISGVTLTIPEKTGTTFSASFVQEQSGTAD